MGMPLAYILSDASPLDVLILQSPEADSIESDVSPLSVGKLMSLLSDIKLSPERMTVRSPMSPDETLSRCFIAPLNVSNGSLSVPEPLSSLPSPLPEYCT